MRTVRGERSVSPGEAALAAALERHVGSLTAGHRHPVLLDQLVDDGFGRLRPGGVCGWVERTSPGGIQIRVLDTPAGRTAEALLEEDLLDVTVSGYPAVIRLTSWPSR